MTATQDAPGATEHATAIIVGETGILFVGPSGAGKSTMAFSCLSAARAIGWNAALIADDRTRLEARAGRCIASCPEPIRGMIELRGGGIAQYRRVRRGVIHLVVAPVPASPADRLPETGETFPCNGIELPLQRMWHDGAVDPLSALCALRPDCFSVR
ncbi:HPr kinase/phosphorylase [Hoeflea sp.]|uniref:HPr kinase/phosphorylase n=1 Tax=Hoeflea sp. TaxID=1940281 RepID=UPI003B5289C8